MHHSQRLNNNNTPSQKRTNHVGSSKALAEEEEGCTSNFSSSLYNNPANKSLSKILVEEDGLDSNISPMYNRSGNRSYLCGRIGSGKNKTDYASPSTSSHSHERSSDDSLNGNLHTSVSTNFHCRSNLMKSPNVSESALGLDVEGTFDSFMNDQHVWSSSSSRTQAVLSSSRKKSLDKDSRRYKIREASVPNGKASTSAQPVARVECSNKTSASDQLRLHNGSSDNVPQKLMRRGSSSKAPYIDDVTTSSYVERKYRPSKNEFYNNVEIEKSSNEKKPPLPQNSIATNVQRRSGQSASAVAGDQLGKKKVSYNSHRLRPDNLGQWTKDNCAGSGLCALSNLACSSAGDVMPSVSSSAFSNMGTTETDAMPSSSSSMVGDRHRRPFRPFSLTDHGQASRVVQHGKTSFEHGRRFDAEPSSGTRNSSSQEQHLCPTLKPSRAGTTPHIIHMGSRYPQNLVPSDFTAGVPFSERGSIPGFDMNDDRFQYLPRTNNLFLDAIPPYQEPSQANYGRNLCANQPEAPREESRILNRSRPAAATATLSRMHDTHYMRSNFSGPPPARPPPLPPAAHFEVFSEPSATVSWSATQDSYLSQFMGSTTSHSEANGQGSTDIESMNFRSSRPYGDARPRINADSLSEILSALQAIERDEDLSYEQILMLEATILLGGIGLSDRYRDMRIDIDNMSYEELLALEERIGNVNTGLSEESATKCLRIVGYVPPANDLNCAPQDIEIKCSICQEEFQESVELGVLQCGHSHHIDCIKQWLSQKNQCPICKASAAA